MNKLIIGGGALILLVAAGGGYYWFKPRHAGAAPAAVAAPPPPPKVAYIDAKEMTLRLADTAAEHYIKLTPVMAVRVKQAEEVTERVAVVRDRIVAIVTARPSTELATPQGEAALKRDLMAALKPDFHDDIVDIYFSGYLVE
ncbi:MAG TPA: flagellar basal body-associated FliL family protein [Candidatus Binataceae bacterium]|nr:flagellar basal body-associated FliL family protein [Candidatus Binataceae bacterium]